MPGHVSIRNQLAVDVAADFAVPPAAVDVNDADHVPLRVKQIEEIWLVSQSEQVDHLKTRMEFGFRSAISLHSSNSDPFYDAVRHTTVQTLSTATEYKQLIWPLGNTALLTAGGDRLHLPNATVCPPFIGLIHKGHREKSNRITAVHTVRRGHLKRGFMVSGMSASWRRII